MAKKRASKRAVAVPSDFNRPKSITEPDAHALVARTAASMGPPPYICVPTGPPPAPCLRYRRDPKTGEYSIPPFGEPMDCAVCRGSARTFTRTQ
jgi:hypothetical protein